jgi:hypothetical protein
LAGLAANRSLNEGDEGWDELFTKHPEVLEGLAAEADIEVAAGRVKDLVPEEL